MSLALLVPAAILAFTGAQDGGPSVRVSANADEDAANSAATGDGDAKPWVGLYVMKVTERLAEKLEIDAEDGVVVVKVVEDGPADEAGIERGDVIASIGDTDIAAVSDVREAVEAASVGDTLAFTIERGGSESTHNVTVGERPAREGKKRDGDCDGKGKGRASTHRGKSAAVSSAGIGAVVASLNEDLAEKLEIEATEGVAVVKVVADSPADDAGLQAGDVIVSVDGSAVESVSDVAAAVKDAEAGDTLTVVVDRDGESSNRTLSVTVEEGYGVGRKGGPGGLRGKVLRGDGETLDITIANVTVAAIGADSVTLTPSEDGAEDITATVTDTSILVKDGEKAGLSDLAVDDEGHAVIVNGDLKALLIGGMDGVRGFDRFGGGEGGSLRFSRGFGGGALTLPPGFFGGRDFPGPLSGFQGAPERPQAGTTT